MNIPNPAPVASSQPRPKKEMLSVSYEAYTALEDSVSVIRTRTVVRINNSSLDLINTCERKAKYALKDDLRASEESAATLFGSAIHKGIELWYTAPRSSRRALSSTCETDGGVASGHNDCARCAALRGFGEVSRLLQSLDIGDKRHPYNGYRLLNTYFDKYLTDPFEILCDPTGAPYVERRFEFTLHEEPGLKIIFFGIIDAILRNVETGITLVCDHKTTSSLSSEFYNRIKPNHQYTGYLLGARKCFGLDTDLFLVNGLQVAKTKADCARQVTQRTEEDYEELRLAVVSAVRRYLTANERGWPQNAPNPCSAYGGCQYRPICEVPKSLKQNVIEALYKVEI